MVISEQFDFSRHSAFLELAHSSKQHFMTNGQRRMLQIGNEAYPSDDFLRSIDGIFLITIIRFGRPKIAGRSKSVVFRLSPSSSRSAIDAKYKWASHAMQSDNLRAFRELKQVQFTVLPC